MKRTILVLGVLMVLAIVGGRKIAHRLLSTRVHAAAQVGGGPLEKVLDLMGPRDANLKKPTRLDAWEVIGPGGGGTFHNPSISPHDPNLVFVSTDMSSCFASEDGGKTWREFNLRYTCTFLFDPKLPNRVYALANDSGFFRSDDRGHTWSLVYPDPGSNPTPRFYDNESGIILHSGSVYPQAITAAAMDPEDSDTIYISVNSELRVTHDAGKSWKTLASDAYAQRMYVDPSTPRNKRAVYMTHNEENAIWDGSKLTTKLFPEGRPQRFSSAFGTPTAGGKPVQYAADAYVFKGKEMVGGGIQATRDGGLTWYPLNEGLLKLFAKNINPTYMSVGTSKNHAEVIYMAYEGVGFANDPNGWFGIVKSTDGGQSWTVLVKESGVGAENMHDAWITRRFGPDFSDEPLYIGVDDNNPDLVYTSDLGRVMRSTNGGKTWEAVYSQSTGKGYTTTGLDVTTCYGVHFDPFDSKRMFITYTDIGLMRSEDGGESWVSSTTGGVPFRWRNTTYWVEFDPAVKGKMWAVMTDMHDLPLLKQVRHIVAAHGGVVTSLDGGKTWKITTGGLPGDLAPTFILMDPTSPPAARVLYITAFGKGVYKSTDGGQNWVAKNSGLPEKTPYVWRMTRAKDGTLYVVTTRTSEDGKFGNDQDGMLFRSTDGADSWQRITLPSGLNGPNGIETDPQDPKRLYLSAWGRYKLYDNGNVAQQGGVWISPDGGQHWDNTLDMTQRIYDVTVDPKDPNVVYAAGSETAAYRSTDRGKTWTRLRGFNFRVARRVIPDPVDTSKVFITTFGSSVWHGPAVGDPNAPEDIVSPPMMMFKTADQQAKGK